MLTPAYLAGISADVVDVYAQVEQEIADDIVKRIIRVGYVSPYSEWQYQKAREIGMFQQGVSSLLEKASVTASDDVKLLMVHGAKTSLAYDDAIYRAAGLTPVAITQSPPLQALVLQGTDKTLHLLSNFTHTTSIESYAAFQSVLDRTYIKILSGAYSPQTAIHAAIKELAQNGIEKVGYNGTGGIRYSNIEVAVRRAVTTGINQSVSKLQLARAEEMGCQLVEVTSHPTARPSHAEWQGQVYSIDPSRHDFPDFYDSTGYGTGEGLCGWNCYHSFYPFFLGLSLRAALPDPAADMGKDGGEEYELSQKQRYYERQIRAAKREVTTWETAVKAAKESGNESLAIEAYADFTKASVKLKRREAALQAFLNESGRTRDWYRLQTGGWNRSVSAKAVWANRRTKK